MASTPPSEQDLDEIRRAAFDLRENDPQEAVRILRRLVKRGGEVEALAHGALGEILLEDFDDVDGALHHYQRLLTLAPGMPAGELGLARAQARNGEIRQAQEAYARALAGLEKLAREAMKATDTEPEGIDETVLTSLELAVEERELLAESHQGKPLTHPGDEVLQWAESVRLFDAEEEGEIDDWLRYTQLRAVVAGLDGQAAAGLQHVDRLARLVPLPEEELPRLRSLTHEAAHELPAAAEEALKGLQAAGASPNPDDALRAAYLLSEVERKADAHAVLQRLQQYLRGEEAKELLPDEIREELLAQAEGHLEDLKPAGLISLGVHGGRGPR